MVEVRAPELYESKPSPLVRKHRNAILARVGIDPAIIANELNLKERTVLLIQRKVGVRKVKQKKLKLKGEQGGDI